MNHYSVILCFRDGSERTLSVKGCLTEEKLRERLWDRYPHACFISVVPV